MVLDTVTLGLVLCAFAFISSKLYKYLKIYESLLTDKVDNDNINKYISILFSTTRTVVQALNQTTVDGLKAASEDGKLTKEEAIEIKNRAVDEIIDIISEEGYAILSTVFNDVEFYVGELVDATVKDIKDNKN